MPLLNLQEAFERITDAFVALDNNWCYTYMNNRAGELFGRDPKEMIGRHIWTEFPEGINQQFYKAYYKAMETQEYIYLEEYYPPYDRWFENHIYPSTNGLSIFFADITERKKTALLIEGERKVMELITLDKPLQDVLNTIALNYEAYSSKSLCSILLMDENGTHVKHGAGPSLPDAYNKGIDGKPIGPVAGSCGTAAYTKERVIVADIATNPLWINYRDFALGFGLKSSWSTPIISATGKVYGTFAIYTKEISEPSETELGIIDRYTNLVKIVMEKYQREKQLQKSEEKYRSLIENASDAILITDENGNYLDMNESACKLSGYTKEEITQLKIHDLVAKEEHFIPFRTKEIKSGKTVIQQRNLKAKDGRIIPVEISGKQLPDGNLIAIVRDLSERKKADLEKEKIKKETEALINNTSDLLWSVSTDYKLITANNTFIESLLKNGGYLIKPGDNILGEGHFPEEYTQYWKDIYSKGFAGEKTETEIFTPQVNSSELLWFELKIEPITSEGTVTGIACSMRNITERKKVKQALLKTEKRLQFLLSATPAVIYSAAAVPPFAATFISDNITQQTGYSAQDFIGVPGFWSSNIHPDDRPKIMNDLAHLFEKGEHTHEYRFKISEGRYVWMYDEVRLIYDEKGAPLEMVGYWINIDERKRSEKAIINNEEKYRTLVEQASDAIFIADENGQLITVNTSACKLAAMAEKELLQMRFQDFSVLEDVQKNPFHFDELKAGRSVITERIMKGKNGSIIHVEINAKLLTDGRLLAFVRDISERKKTQASIIQLNDELEQRVKDRTAELEAANAELEEINDLFVGREARIIELKEELEVLKKKHLL